MQFGVMIGGDEAPQGGRVGFSANFQIVHVGLAFGLDDQPLGLGLDHEVGLVGVPLGCAENYLCLRASRGPSADVLITLFQTLVREGRLLLAARVAWAVLWLKPEARR